MAQNKTSEAHRNIARSEETNGLADGNRDKDAPLPGPAEFSDCEVSVIVPPLKEAGDVLGYYDRIRAYLEHEDDLINTRLTWSLTVHGFLFAIYGLLLGKIADLGVELQKHIDATARTSVIFERGIAALPVFQLPIALFGFFLALHSRRAIVAAHNAIQHLITVAHQSDALKLGPEHVAAKSAAAINPGTQTVKTGPPLQVAPGTLLQVRSGTVDTAEVICVEASSSDGIKATFTREHPKEAEFLFYNPSFLPRIVSGGAIRDDRTKAARSYYLALPRWIMYTWLVLGIVSFALFAAALFGRHGFFRLLGVPAT